MDVMKLFSILLLVTPLVSSTIMLRQGDVEVDLILGATEPRDEFSCNENDVSVSAVEIAQTFTYVISDRNNDPLILHDTSMGLAVYDTCRKEEWTKLITESILKRHEFQKLDNDGVYFPAVVMYPSYLPSIEAVRATLNNHKILNIELDFWASGLESTTDGANLDSPYHYIYSSPQILVAQPMKDFLVKYNWTYVSLITSETASSFMVSEAFMKELRSTDSCVATFDRIPSGVTNDEVYLNIIRGLIQKKNARTVLAFLNEKDMEGLAEALDNFPTFANYFIWLTYGGSGTSLSKKGMVINFGKEDVNIDKFIKYYSSLTLENNRNNPWFGKALDFYNDCTLKGGLFGLDCEVTDHPVNLEKRPLDVYYSTISKAVMDYAVALDKSIKRSCKNAMDSTEKSTGSMTCLKSINESLFLENIAEVYHSNQMKFTIEQIFSNSTVHKIGTWESELSISNEPRWEVLRSLTDDHMTYAPLSVCSAPCAHGMKPVYSSSKCCWVCVKV